MTRARSLTLFSALMLFGSAVLPQNSLNDLSKIVEGDVVSAPETKKLVFLSRKNEQPTKKVVKSKIRSSAKITIRPLAQTPKVFIKNGDNEFSIGGKAKVEHYYDKNSALLNDRVFDENNYFKHTVDMNFDFVYGKEKFDHKAVEMYLNARHKGVWGRSQSYADRASSSVDESSVRIGDAVTGQHNHATGKLLPWISEAWLMASFNAMLGVKSENVHSIKLGWFPFELGRGIALGSWYGSNREIFALYANDKEDKFAPGINISGQLIKNKLAYDLYYSRHDEHGKSLSDTIGIVRSHWLDRRTTPWRGINKNDDVFAGRLKWKAFKNDCCGTLDLEPYAYYNNGRDQYVEIEPDAQMKFGAYGLNAEYAKSNFEFGAEAAVNYGKEKLVAIDRNKVVIESNDGVLTQYYDHIVIPGGADTPMTYRAANNYSKPPMAIKNAANDVFVKAYTGSANGVTIGGGLYNDGIPAGTAAGNAVAYNTATSANRFRPAFTNKLEGWMFVTDAAYKLPEYKLKLAIAYGYASGDANPHENEVNKTYKGFVGMNEGYCGKRVPSIFLLDQRLLKRPTSLTENSDELVADMAFTDLHLAGLGATWTPSCGGKVISINPNAVFFWKDHESKKVNITGTGVNDWEASTTQNASKYMGYELNLVTECEMLKDLKIFGKFATFIPGAYFKDITGVPLDGDYWAKVSKFKPAGYSSKDFRLGHDIAYHMNLGMEYKF